MKNQKKIKNKYQTWAVVCCLALGLGLLVSLTGCRGKVGNRWEVMLELPDPASVDFSGYDKVYFDKIELDKLPENFDPKEKIDTFIFTDMARTINRDIAQWDEATAKKSPEKGALLVSGKLKVNIKSRSKIKEVKKEGKKKKTFVTVQHWDMVMTMKIKDIATGKEILNHDFKAKLANADANTVEFNFENLFFKVTNQFLKRVTRTEKMQRRHILL